MLHGVVVLGSIVSGCGSAGKLRNSVVPVMAGATAHNTPHVVARMMLVGRWGNQQNWLQVHRLPGSGYTGNICNCNRMGFVVSTVVPTHLSTPTQNMLTLVHGGALVDGFRLEAHMSRGQDEGQRRQNDAVYAADNRQRVRPPDAAEARLKAIRLGTANLSKIVRVPAKRK